MKKLIVTAAFFLISTLFYSQQYVEKTPELLKGIWQGSDRLILFAGTDSEFSCVLRVFYQWYDDRAAEPSSYSQIFARNRNNTTSRIPENIEIKYKTAIENKNGTAGVYEIQIKYPGLKDNVYVPVAVVGGKIYLNFFIRQNFFEEIKNEQGEVIDSVQNENKYYLVDCGAASGITISPPVIKKELLSYFVDKDSIYHIRYWLSEMEVSDEQAEFEDGEHFYAVNKYIQTAGNVYSCTTGRSKKIRNIKKSSDLPYSFVTDEDKLIYVYGEPYLTYVPETGNQENLQKIIEKNNSRRHPPAKPLFPVSNINFHWKEISELEKYNPYTWNKRNLDIHK